MHKILNLGGGTQSSVLLLMSHLGELPKLDVAIFADTGWEPREVYDHLDWLQSECTSIPIVRVAERNIYEDAMTAKLRADDYREAGGRWASMPFFVTTGSGVGMLRRQCTAEYKIRPIEQYIRREILGLQPRQHWPKKPLVEQWFGISVDEYQRQRTPTGKWAQFRYPLIEMRWIRSKAIDWAAERYPGRVFPRSACIGCPFHSDAEWQRIKNGPADEWRQVVELDKAIRDSGDMRGQVYLHRSCKPIDQVDFRSQDEKSGQLNLWNDECHGMCGT